jgi:hypothetical protein
MRIARKFFAPQKTFVPLPSAGSGYFATQGTSDKISIYDGAAGTVTLSTVAFPQTSYLGNAAGNSTRGIFARSASTTDTYRYMYASRIMSAGGALAGTLTNGNSWVLGNDVKALFKTGNGPGVPSAQISNYIYATDVSAVSAATMSVAIQGANNTANGNITEGIVILAASTGATASTDHYVYASETRDAGTSIPGIGAANAGGTIGNSTRGIFIKSGDIITRGYTWSTGAVATTTSLPAGEFCQSTDVGASDGTTGVFLRGNNSTQSKTWTFSSDTVGNGTVFTANQGGTCPSTSGYNPGVNV